MSDDSIKQSEAVLDTKVVADEESVLEQEAFDDKKTPKRTPKRRSFIERAQRESEELVRNMGGSLELEGGRRTRSSTRGTPTRAAETNTPPPSKKSRSSPVVAKSSSRGRGARKLDIGGEDQAQETEKAKPVEEKLSTEPEKANEEEKEDDAAAEEIKDTEPPKDQPDGVGDLAAVPEEKQNNVDHDKPNKETAEIQEKPAEVVPKSEDPPKINDSAATAAVVAPAVAVMDVDEDGSNSVEETKADSEPEKATEKDDEKAEKNKIVAEEPKVVAAEPTKEATPEPMEVDSSSKSSTEAAHAIPTEEPVPAAETGTKSASSSNIIDEVAAEVKEDVPVVVEKAANDVDTVPAEPAVPAAAEIITPSVVAAVAATNDIDKQVPVTVADTVVVENAEPLAAVKETQVTSEANKSEHNDNGEPTIVNNSEEADNHVTPQACN